MGTDKNIKLHIVTDIKILRQVQDNTIMVDNVVATGPVGEATSSPVVEVAEKKKLKACCACPETKSARDECVIINGEENCTDLIEAHKQCMRDAGFNI